MKNFLNILINKFVSIKPYSHIDNEIKNIFFKKEKKEKYLEKYQIQKQEIKNKKFSNGYQKKYKNYENLIFFYKLLFSQGNVTESLSIRDLIIKEMNKKKITTFDEYVIQIKSLIDDNQLNNALKVINKKKIYFLLLPKFYFFIFYLNNIKALIEKIIFKNGKNLRNISAIINKNNEKQFSTLIENKSIAVVGPGHSTDYKGTEIDSFDIVVRINTFSNHGEKYKKYIGSKTDIIYFNGGEFTKFENGKKVEFLNNVFLCSRKSFSKEFRKKNIRPTRKLNFNLFGGNGFIQDIIIDLLHFNTKEIKIFNVDFTLNNKMYNANYTKPNLVSQKEAYYRQSKVDFFSNINFMRLLMQNNTIKVDNNLNILLNYSNFELSKLFAKFYNIESLKIN